MDPIRTFLHIYRCRKFPFPVARAIVEAEIHSGEQFLALKPTIDSVSRFMGDIIDAVFRSPDGWLTPAAGQHKEFILAALRAVRQEYADRGLFLEQ